MWEEKKNEYEKGERMTKKGGDIKSDAVQVENKNKNKSQNKKFKFYGSTGC
jgi:hypothetical protein